ncbi:replicative DNA helicase [Shinella zoogloeoides]|uniref:replicative DNA helicase n=1 Tax=Shinella zoogloeoides TaxID=352475 RepID=UPI00299EE5CF|nr:DnaB-like helicase C-terminal domain-containing protein [Shinella zoogloeoides]
MNNDALDAIRVPLEPSHFYEPINRDIFDAMLDLRKAGRVITTISVKSYVPSGQVRDMTVPQYLARLAANAVTVVNAPDYAYGIMDCAARRAFVALGQKMEDAAFSLDLEIMDEVEALRNRFEDIIRALNGPSTARTLADGAKRALESTATAYRGSGVAGVDYGIRFLMDMVGPFLPGQLIVIGGGTKQGKSSLIEQIIHGAASNGHPVWVYSGEMGIEELAHRSLSRVTDIQAWRQIRGKVSEREYEQLETARRNAETWQDRVFIRDDSMTLGQIERDLKDFAKRHPGGMAIIDHIGLVERDREMGKLSEVELGPYITKRLKLIANRFRLPVVAAAQLKKNTFAIEDRKMSRATYQMAIGRRPKYADIYGSCEKDANAVIIPYRAEPILQELEPSEGSDLHPVWEEVMSGVRGRAEVILALSRHTHWPQRKEVRWNGARTSFEDLSADDQARFF